ncbi:MAG: hypothetical protein HKM92_01545 [Arenibacter sp.]|nr:hypothetical protein [Muriicola sp.]NNE03185.1 hypothetical protein [Eudoraea sp.]NNG08827.1 hypothetical protein [Arenibacter sp.]
MRPYIAYFILVLVAILSFSLWSCTNNEGEADLDFLTPTDSLEATVAKKDIPT